MSTVAAILGLALAALAFFLGRYSARSARPSEATREMARRTMTDADADAEKEKGNARRSTLGDLLRKLDPGPKPKP